MSLWLTVFHLFLESAKPTKVWKKFYTLHRFAFFMGLSVPEYFSSNPLTLDPEWLSNIINTLGSTGMAVGAFIALLLDNTVPGTDEERGLTAWGRM